MMPRAASSSSTMRSPSGVRDVLSLRTGSLLTLCWSKADSNSESHPRATPPAATRFVADYALEGAGFELLVRLTQKSHAVWGGESPNLEAIAEHLPPKILAV
jgi:hypothetical protein